MITQNRQPHVTGHQTSEIHNNRLISLQKSQPIQVTIETLKSEFYKHSVLYIPRI